MARDFAAEDGKAKDELRLDEVPASAPVVEEEAPAAPARRGWGRRLLLLGVAAVALTGAAWYGHSWWTVGRFLVETEDAYVQADFAVMAPKLTGYVASVPAIDNRAVHSGDPLVLLEDGDYRDALTAAQSQLAAQQATVARIEAEARAADAAVAEAEARVEGAEATARQAAADLARYSTLADNAVASAQRLEEVQADAASAQASLKASRAEVASAEANRAVITSQRAEAIAAVPGLEAGRDRAQRDLDATVIRAPFDGTIGNLSVAVGDLVAPGKRLMAVVPTAAVYVEANFKETQIEALAPGTKVTLHFDAFPDRDLVGAVDGIAPASGAQFSLLPPENATGNFTKVVQRVPVRISIPADAAAEGWLRPGLSVHASADTRGDAAAPANAVAAAH